MDQTQLAIDFYRQQADLLRAHLSDFSEADMRVRPVPDANHAAWQVGHLTYSLVALINAVTPGALPGLPADFVQRHSSDGARLDDGFDSKDQLLDRFDQVNEQAITWVQSVVQADYDKPTPQRLQGFAATVGHLIFALPPHTMLHLGQIQVIRRALGKPRLL
jgi:DinB superfamily